MSPGFLRVLYRFFLLTNTFVMSAQTGFQIDKSHFEFYDITNYRVEDGLLQNTVKDMVIDTNGFLWVASEKGLSRFDGSRFRHFHGKPFSWSRGRLDRIYRYKDTIFPRSGGYFYLWNSKLVGPQKTNPFENKIRELNGRRLWDKDTDLFVEPMSIHELNREMIYLDDHHFYLSNGASEMEFFKNGVVGGIIQDGQGTALSNYFSMAGSLFALNGNTLKKYHRISLVKEFSLKPLSTRAVIIGKNNIGSRYIYDPPTGRIYSLDINAKGPRLTLVIQWLENMESSCMVQSGQDFFIGTRTKGLYYFKRKQFFNVFSKEHPHLNNTRSGVLVGRDSLLFGKNLLVTPTESYNNYLSEIDPFYSVADLEGNLWFKGDSSIFKVKKGEITLKLRGPGEHIGNLELDKEGRVWGLSHRGLFYIENERVNEVIFDTINGHDEQVYYQPFTENFRLSNGWIYDPQKKEVKVDPALRGEEALFQYFTENMNWLRLSDRGMYMERGEKLMAFPTDPYEYMRYAHCILEDENGFFWISSDYGIFQVLKKDLLYYFENPSFPVYYHYYDKSYGFRNNEFNSKGHPCGLKLPDGQFAFPSFEGLVFFDPKEVKAQRHGGGVVIDQITIDGQDSTLLDNGYLNQNFKELEFQIAQSFFGHPNNLYLQYMLVGYHEHWQTLNPDQPIKFSELKHGDYQLKVRKLIGFGGQIAECSLAFTVRKHYYQTFWFQSSLGIAIALLVIGLFNSRARAAKNRQIALEQVIEDKTHEYRILNEQLKLNVARLRESEKEQRKTIKMKDRMMAIYTHDIRGPLRFIKTIANRSINKINELTRDEVVRFYRIIMDSTSGVYEHTERMFNWSRMQGEDFKVELVEINARQYIQEAIDHYKNQAETKSVRLYNHVSSSFSLFTEGNLFSITINNILQNAVKYTAGGSIRFEAYKIPGFNVISVTDTGVGIGEDQLLDINIGEYKSMPGTDNEKGKGFGLKVIMDFLSRLGGYMEIQSELGEGTTVSLFFPDKD